MKVVSKKTSYNYKNKIYFKKGVVMDIDPKSEFYSLAKDLIKQKILEEVPAKSKESLQKINIETKAETSSKLD